jgi:gluconolactonase
MEERDMTTTDALEALLDPSAERTRIADGFWFTEGPSWDPGRQELVFSDIPRDTRWRWNAREGLQQVETPTFKGNGTVFEDDGSLLVCEQVSSCVTRIHLDGRREVVAFHHEGRYLNSPNDIIVRSDGLIYFTDPNFGRWDGDFGLGRRNDLDYQGVFRMHRDGSELTLVSAEPEFEQPNGLCFSPDESILYVNDSPAGEIKAYDVAADGSLSGVRLLIGGLGDGVIAHGTPDGMKCDALGNVWCSGPGGVWVIDPAGTILGHIEVPEVVGSLTWGGEDLRTLFLTSSDVLYTLRTRVAGATLPGRR